MELQGTSQNWKNDRMQMHVVEKNQQIQAVKSR